MLVTNLRKVGGSIMLAVPPAVLDLLNLKAGSPVGISVEKNYLLVRPFTRPHYTLEELLQQCVPYGEEQEEETKWLNSEELEVELL